MEMLIPHAPVFASLELNADCNNACPGCANRFLPRRTTEPLSVDDWLIVLERLQSAVVRLVLTGGEPTLSPHFVPITEHLNHLRWPFGVFTNARWPDPDSLVAFLKSAPACEGLLISLHGPDAVTHEAFTGVPGSFAETVDNIRRALKADLAVTTSTVLTAANCDKINALVALAVDLGVPYMAFNRYIGPPTPGLTPSKAAFRRAAITLSRLIQACQTNQSSPLIHFGTCIPSCFAGDVSNGCLSGMTYITVDPWGDVRPCNHAPIVCGNLLHQPLDAIWYSESMAVWRQAIPEVCQGCAELSRCHGGCRATRALYGSERDPLCEGPLFHPLKGERAITLFEDLHPDSDFQLRPESFGYLVIRGNRVMPVAPAAIPILNALDGQMTLRQIQDHFGDQALSFIVSLYRQGMVDLVE